jgi:hypothetical protein
MAIQRLQQWDDNSKTPIDMDTDLRGVTDWGNLFQFAPYESGYCFLVVLGVPTLANGKGDLNTGFKELQTNFVKILENEFLGLSGIEDYSVESYTVGIHNSQQEVISKVKGMSNTQISITLNEKSGTPITTYLSEYLRRVRNPYTGITSYHGAVGSPNMIANGSTEYIDPYKVAQYKEVFTMLYIVTDNTCLNVEKAFGLINCRPQSASYSDLYNITKGDISTHQVSVNFSCSVREGDKINSAANMYLDKLIKTTANPIGVVDYNSYDFDWSITGIGDPIKDNIHAKTLGLAGYKETDSSTKDVTYDVKWTYQSADGTEHIDSKYKNKKSPVYFTDDTGIPENYSGLFGEL